ncbi:MAG: sugar phosphate isomerase/epimerase [Desulfobacteraceae bacterium]|jgi:sugar phosphate isomerase/epimerase|nr:sugar phosphate isomerase/epimerase [Desulfobacteraceae bacterium]
MRFGAMNFPVRPVVEEIRAIAMLGFDYLELTLDAPLAHHDVVRLQRSEILGALADGGLGLICHLPTFVSTADLTPTLRQASREEIRRSLDVAADLGAEKVVAHPPSVGPMGALAMDLVRPLVAEGMAEMLAHAASLGVCVCLENMFPRYRVGVEPSEFEPLLAAWPDLRLTLDVGHAFIQDRKTRRLLTFIETLGQRIGHLHLSDNKGQRDEHLPLGQGRIPYDRIVRALMRHVDVDTVTLEIFTERREDLVASREAFLRLAPAG